METANVSNMRERFPSLMPIGLEMGTVGGTINFLVEGDPRCTQMKAKDIFSCEGHSEKFCIGLDFDRSIPIEPVQVMPRIEVEKEKPINKIKVIQ